MLDTSLQCDVFIYSLVFGLLFRPWSPLGTIGVFGSYRYSVRVLFASRLKVSQYLNRKRQERSVTAGLTLEADGNLDCR